ncbi:MAG: TlpA disulfide reductase family protein [Rhodocyclaceae bacterium]|nr:TlpA disulfide reductase family protein [Rhodocyclaceae bacterium]
MWRWILLFGLLAASGVAPAASSDALFAAKLSSSDDKPVALESFRGKPLIVNFWARWCAPCRVEIPELIRTHDKYRKKGLVVLGIGLEDKAESVRDFMKAYEMNYPVLLAGDKGIELMQALGNSKAGLPFTIAVNRRGEIVASKLGAMNKAELEAAAEAVLK